MTTKEALEKIKRLIFAEMDPQQPVVGDQPKPVEEKFEDYKLKDGSIVSIDKLEVGGIVTVSGAPVPDGEYELEDGKKFVVSGGAIVEIELTASDVVEGEAPAVAVVPEAMAQLPAQFAAHQSEVENLKSIVAKQDETIKQMFSLLETVANTSVQQPVEKVKSFDDMTPLEKWRALKK